VDTRVKNGHTLSPSSTSPLAYNPRRRYQNGPKTNARQFQVGTNRPPWRAKIANAGSVSPRSRAAATPRGRSTTAAGVTPAA
jgi:hypothetical protein